MVGLALTVALGVASATPATKIHALDDRLDKLVAKLDADAFRHPVALKSVCLLTAMGLINAHNASDDECSANVPGIFGDLEGRLRNPQRDHPIPDACDMNSQAFVDDPVGRGGCQALKDAMHTWCGQIVTTCGFMICGMEAADGVDPPERCDEEAAADGEAAADDGGDAAEENPYEPAKRSRQKRLATARRQARV